MLGFYSTMICARVVKKLVWNTKNSPPMQLRNPSTNWPNIQRILNRILPAIERLRDCLEIVALMFTFCKSFQVNKRLGKSVQKELVYKYEVFISLWLYLPSVEIVNWDIFLAFNHFYYDITIEFNTNRHLKWFNSSAIVLSGKVTTF